MNPDDAYQQYRDETTAELKAEAPQLSEDRMRQLIYRSLLSTIAILDEPEVPEVPLDTWTTLLQDAYNAYHHPIEEDDDDAPF